MIVDVKYNQMYIARSSNGRTAVSGTVNRGSSPCPAALRTNDNYSFLAMVVIRSNN